MTAELSDQTVSKTNLLADLVTGKEYGVTHDKTGLKINSRKVFFFFRFWVAWIGKSCTF